MKKTPKSQEKEHTDQAIAYLQSLLKRAKTDSSIFGSVLIKRLFLEWDQLDATNPKIPDLIAKIVAQHTQILRQDGVPKGGIGALAIQKALMRTGELRELAEKKGIKGIK
jgi:hypothetical protein